jgi:hypothetical protein
MVVVLVIKHRLNLLMLVAVAVEPVAALLLEDLVLLVVEVLVFNFLQPSRIQDQHLQ